MFDLTGKIALVSGAGSGIGAAISEALANAGACVFVTDIQAEGGQAVVQRIQSGGHQAEFLRLDVTREADCRRAGKHVLASRGRLDVLVNNAGIGCVGTLLQTSGEDLDRLYAVNVRGMFNLTKVFLVGMIERKSGVILNMASIGGVVGVHDRLAYCTTKFAVVGMTKSLALDHSHQGIRVNCICPARVETAFVKARLAEYADPETARREMCSTQLTGRMLRPEEVAAAAVYLASDETASITGSAFMVDAGWSAGK